MKRAPLLAWLLLLGCPADTNPASAGSESDTESNDDGADDDDADDDDSDPSADSSDPGSGSTSGTSDSDSDSDSEGETESGEDLPPPPATGIQIVDVTADQGVRVPIALGGVLVDGSGRNVPLLRERATVIRAFYELDPDFEERDIYAVLYAEQTDGSVTEYASFAGAIHKDCGAETLIDCRYATMGNGFTWRIEPASVRPGTAYRVELFETAPGHEEDVSEKVPLFPVDGGTMQIGIEDTYMKMRVVVVPVDHDIGNDCPEPPDLTEDYGPGVDGEDRAIADFFAERLRAQNPVDEVEIILHDTVRYTGSLQGSQLLGALQNLRFQEGAPPEQFYYAVARPCDGGPDFAGVAQLGGPTPGQAGNRVGWGVYYGNVGSTADTFVHEIGHEQGRSHIACNGEEAGPDPSYPAHPMGDLVSWGVDAMGTSLKVYGPDDHDYMTYCGSTWVSEWGYLKVFPWIEEMSSWEVGDHGGSQQELLVGNIAADGTESWYRTRGYMPWANVTPEHTVRFSGAGGATEDVPAAWMQWERSEDVNVIVPVPTDFATVTEVAWTGADGSAHVIDEVAARADAATGFATLQ